MSKTSVRKDIEKSVEEADYRDIFEKALEERDAFQRSETQRKLKEQRQKEIFEGNMRGILGGALGLGAYALGRKLIRKRFPKFDEGVYTIPPVAALTAGAATAIETGSYPASEAERKRKRERYRKE